MKTLKQGLRDHLLGQGLTNVFDTFAPAGQAYPYVLFQYVAGGYENLTALDTRSELWQVKAVADNHDTAHTLAAQIHTALHGQPLTLAGWQHLWTVQVDQVWMVEWLGGAQIYHAGGSYRILLHRG